MRKSRGITLIALVITIIILIILAGVAINLSIGDNGIFNKAKLAKEKYNEESIREKVELGIMELEIEELTLGNQVTIESVLQELLEKETFETIDKDVAIGNIGEYEVKLKYNEQGKVVIEYIEKATGVRVTYKLNPESYTNGEKVGILLTVNGKVKSVTKPDNLVIYPENNTVAINYQVTENGTYKFIIESEDGNKQEKNVIVDTIDRLPPNDFTITAENIEGGIKIIANTTDAESDGVSVKSGVDRYEYFVKGESDTEYLKCETNEIKELKIGTYSVYVIAYDKVGNPKNSNIISVVLTAPYDAPYIPTGFRHKEGTWNNGFTIIGETESVGNEFVWVPCVIEQSQVKEGHTVVTFGKIKTGEYNNRSYTLLSPINDSEEEIETSVSTYGGFYIAKYEAGIEDENDNLTLSLSGKNKITNGEYKPLSQPGKGVWNYISRWEAITVSESMINQTITGVKSTLISGAAWDTTLQWMVNASENKDEEPNLNYDINSDKKGWYFNVANNTIHLTGYFPVNNIYDMAGNVWEYTTERGKFYSTEGGIFRGGEYRDSIINSAAFRNISFDNKASPGIGFRVVLYK